MASLFQIHLSTFGQHNTTTTELISFIQRQKENARGVAGRRRQLLKEATWTPLCVPSIGELNAEQKSCWHRRAATNVQAEARPTAKNLFLKKHGQGRDRIVLNTSWRHKANREINHPCYNSSHGACFLCCCKRNGSLLDCGIEIDTDVNNLGGGWKA